MTSRRRWRRLLPVAALLAVVGTASATSCRRTGPQSGSDGPVRITELGPRAEGIRSSAGEDVTPADASWRRDSRLVQGRALRAIHLAPGQQVWWEIEPASGSIFSFRPSAGDGEHCTFVVTVQRPQSSDRQELYRGEHAGTSRHPHEPVVVELGDDAGRSAGRSMELAASLESTEAGSCSQGRLASPLLVEPDPAARGGDASSPPNILLIGLDTLRADALGAYGRSPSLTPHLDRFARSASVWTAAFTNINSTNPSFVSLMTGRHAKNHGVYDLETPVADEALTLAELLADAGYRTGAVISARHLSDAAGLAQGFERFARPHSQFYAEAAIDTLIGWLQEGHEQGGATQAPFFYWLHLFDAHVPHTPPQPFASGYFDAAVDRESDLARLAGAVSTRTPFREPGPREFEPRTRLKGHEDLYDGEVAYLDSQLGRLFTLLERRGLAESTLVAIVADHGETLGERGHWFDHVGLYDIVTHVPLMVRRPGQRSGSIHSELVQHFDLFATLLLEAGVDPPPSDSRPLVVAAGGPEVVERTAVFGERVNAGGWMVRTPAHKLVITTAGRADDPRVELYDLVRDPAETEDLAGRGLPVEATLVAMLDRWRTELLPHVAPESIRLTEEERRELEALGYID